MNREQLLKEARTTEAMKKGYLGLEGVFAVICRRLGHPIIVHGGSDPVSVGDDWLLEEPGMPTMSETDHSYEIGVLFDGLSMGMNLTVSVMHHLAEVTCRYEGRVVYHEVGGELERYSPDPSWEDNIERAVGVARKIERREREGNRRAVAQEAVARRQQILQDLKEKWGL